MHQSDPRHLAAEGANLSHNCFPDRSAFLGQYHKFQLGSPALQVEEREITVWIPPGFSKENAHELHILVSLDGHALRDDPERNSPRTLALEARLLELNMHNPLKPVAIISIPNLGHGERVFNFCSRDYEHLPAHGVERGNLENFTRWLEFDLKNALVEKFGFNPDAKHWGLVGSSLAAAPAFWLAFHSKEFSTLFPLSPGLWSDYEQIDGKRVEVMRSIFDFLPVPDRIDNNLFLGVGSREGRGGSSDGPRNPNQPGALVEHTSAFLRRIERSIQNGSGKVFAKLFHPDFHTYDQFKLQPADHSEMSWGAMMHEFMPVAFGR